MSSTSGTAVWSHYFIFILSMCTLYQCSFFFSQRDFRPKLNIGIGLSPPALLWFCWLACVRAEVASVTVTFWELSQCWSSCSGTRWSWSDCCSYYISHNWKDSGGRWRSICGSWEGREVWPRCVILICTLTLSLKTNKEKHKAYKTMGNQLWEKYQNNI